MPIEKPPQFQSNSSSNVGCGHFKSNLVSSMAAINLKSKESAFEMGAHSEIGANVKLTEANSETLPFSNPSTTTDLDSFCHGNIDGLSDILLPINSDPMKSSPSTDYLSVSPSFGPWSLSFDQKVFDETTPDEFAPINFLKGISNINYDFISDNSAENSVSDDVGDMQADQSNAESFAHPVKTSDSTCSFNLDEFDPLRSANSTSAPLATASQSKPLNINLIDSKPTTLIESEDSPNQVLLPSPLKPTATDYKGFSNSKIPSISCNTGDFSSLNPTDVNSEQN